MTNGRMVPDVIDPGYPSMVVIDGVVEEIDRLLLCPKLKLKLPSGPAMPPVVCAVAQGAVQEVVQRMLVTSSAEMVEVGLWIIGWPGKKMRSCARHEL